MGGRQGKVAGPPTDEVVSGVLLSAMGLLILALIVLQVRRPAWTQV